MGEDRDAEAGEAIRRTRARGTGRNPGRACVGASTPRSAEANRVARNQDLIGQMTDRGNMNAAWRKVRRNGGSAVDRPSRRIFLVYSFTAGKSSRIRVPKDSVQKMKSKLKRRLGKARGRKVEDLINETRNPLLRGWTSYFRLTQTQTLARVLGEWLGHRLRCVIWRPRKRPRTRYKRLISQGLEPQRARKSSFNGRGPWFGSGASHMNAALPRQAFTELNLLSVYDHLRLLRREI